MIPIIMREVSEKRKWITNGEILDILAVAESTPGPIAVNTATYVGYTKKGVLGAIIATIGLIIPSFVIIFILSLFYKEVIKWTPFIAIFKGVKVGVIILLLNAIIKLSKSVEANKIGIIIFSITLIGMLLLSFFNITIPGLSISFIVLGIIVGIVVEIITHRRKIE